jgi:hypothetical protein
MQFLSADLTLLRTLSGEERDLLLQRDLESLRNLPEFSGGVAAAVSCSLTGYLDTEFDLEETLKRRILERAHTYDVLNRALQRKDYLARIGHPRLLAELKDLRLFAEQAGLSENHPMMHFLGRCVTLMGHCVSIWSAHDRLEQELVPAFVLAPPRFGPAPVLMSA